MLQNAGYQTALIGKWHLKTKPQGFDTWKILSGQGRYYNPLFITGEDTIRHQGYVTTLITDFAIETIDKFDKNRPLLKNENINKTLKNLYAERKEIYKEANHRIVCDGINKLDLAKKVFELYENQ